MEITKHGNNFNHLRCNSCGCEFNYLNKDVDIEVYKYISKPYRKWVVICPECNHHVEIKWEYIEK